MSSQVAPGRDVSREAGEGSQLCLQQGGRQSNHRLLLSKENQISS